MAYTIKYTDSTKTALSVAALSADTSTNLTMVGQGFNNYGEAVNENFLHLLENFASGAPPAKPVEGQLWYDSSVNQLKYFDDTVGNSGNWKPIASMTVQATTPVATGESDGHYWLDDGAGILYLRYNGEWVEIFDTSGDTRIVSRTRYDTGDVSHRTIEVIVNNVIMSIQSSDLVEWNPQNSGENTEYLEDGTTLLNTLFPVINPGITMNNNGTFKFYGTATYADDLVGITKSDILLLSQAIQRLPIFPQIQTPSGRLSITSPSTGVIRIPAGETFLHRGIKQYTTVQTDFTTVASTTYHLTWTPTGGYTLNRLNSTAYNPTSLAETDSFFDSDYDRMLIARVVTNASNVATITTLTNDTQMMIAQRTLCTNYLNSGENGANADYYQDLNWARTPRQSNITIDNVSYDSGKTVDGDIRFWQATSARNLDNTPAGPYGYTVTRYALSGTLMYDGMTSLALRLNATA